MEQNRSLHSLLRIASAQIDIPLHETQIERFMVYLRQLQTWNRSINLTSLVSDEEIIIKHFVDSLAALKAEELKNHAALLDIGTGAGFPGIPLRIVREDLDLTLIEPSQKKISFLHFIVGLLRLERVRIFCGTFERFLVEEASKQRFDYISTRALKPDVILRCGRKLLRDGGKTILYLSSPMSTSDIDQGWAMVNEFKFDLPNNSGRRVVSILALSQNQIGNVPRRTPSCSS